jgi:hypothetical protein
MNSAKLNDWLQVIGLFGVIGSLLFVGLQLKQEQEIAMSAAYQARSQQISDITTAWADNPAARGAIVKLQSGRAQEVTPDEALALNFYESAVLNAYENIHFQYLSGFVTEEHWAKSRAGLKNFLRSERSRSSFFNNWSGQDWRASFYELAEQLVAEIDSEEKQNQ